VPQSPQFKQGQPRAIRVLVRPSPRRLPLPGRLLQHSELTHGRFHPLLSACRATRPARTVRFFEVVLLPEEEPGTCEWSRSSGLDFSSLFCRHQTPARRASTPPPSRARLGIPSARPPVPALPDIFLLGPAARREAVAASNSLLSRSRR